ncbi:hypothetical protein H5410_041730 [Solanum commersonii]|uniref:Uncharacterized protein n=1 Tax=Solanum commersonii TaxID=4109 RepID=A0A9J5XVJ8_SOLCO|nr:hypothetical protein H5410_041730 [Solanum commersonii]
MENRVVRVPGVQPVVAASHLAVPLISTIYSPMASRSVMSFEEQKILGQFIRLGPLKFTSDSGENAHEFNVSCYERLHNLRLVKSHDVDYSSFHMNVSAKQSWRYYLECRLA